MEQLEHYNLVDILILSCVCIAVVLGFWRGFARTLTAVAGVIIGVVAAGKYYPVVEPYLSKISSLDPYISAILSMVIIFIAIQAIFVFIRKVLEALLDFTRLSWLDRIFGACMGALAGFLFVAATVHILLAAVPEWSSVNSSKLLRPVERLTGLAMNYVPEKIVSQFQVLTSRWKGALDSSSPNTPRQSDQSTKGGSLSQGRVR
jgi:membrane protein required for colicin V production